MQEIKKTLFSFKVRDNLTAYTSIRGGGALRRYGALKRCFKSVIALWALITFFSKALFR